MSKTRLKAQAAGEQASRGSENEALQAFSIEQARWLDPDARLDALEWLAPIPR